MSKIEAMLNEVQSALDRQYGDHPRTGEAATILAILVLAKAVLLVGKELENFKQAYSLRRP